MKFFQKYGRQHTDKKMLHYKYWILCFSLLYFLLSSLATHKPVPYFKTHPSKSCTTASRAAKEPINSTFQHHMNNRVSKLKNLKVYIYELPSRYNADWLKINRCSTHLFASEVAIHKALLSNEDVRTMDAEEADFFFVPVYVSCNFGTANGFPAFGHARSLLHSAVNLVSSKHPFWNRTNGSDHVFVASHDYGACFHAMEERAVLDGIPHFLKNSIILQTFGVQHEHACQDARHVVVPPYISPEIVRIAVEQSYLSAGRRDIWAFFRGKMEVHPKNISGNFYSKKVRTRIWRAFNGDRRFYLRRHRFAGYQSEMARSVFCLCPLGWAPWSPRIIESVELGCVPVIIADGIRLPFQKAIPWPDISLTVAEDDVEKLPIILERVAASNLSTITKNLGDLSVKKALRYNIPMREGDATWHILCGLSRMLPQSPTDPQ